MSTVVRAKLSEKNKYWIDKHRHYELKHFCLQYPIWKKAYAAITELSASSILERIAPNNTPSDLTAKCAMRKTYYSNKIKLIEWAAKEADEELYFYILKAVTEGLSYTHLRTKLDMPCGRDMYYDRYRRFFWLLDKERD